MGQGRIQLSLLGQGGVSPALKTSPQNLTGCSTFQFSIVQNSESWWLKHLPSDKSS